MFSLRHVLGDTIIVLTFGVMVGVYFMGFTLKDSVVIAGATSICGSSAATAISASIHPKGYKDEVVKTIIALMGVLNAPLMPLMPLIARSMKVNSVVEGAWIGGSIDSTGQVVASAQMGSALVLQTAVIIKMAQNILIGPLCVIFTAYFQKSFQPSILVSRFPLFVVGFFITSIVATIIIHTSNNENSNSLQSLIIPNSWNVSEWMTLIGFCCIGLEIDVKAFFTGNSRHSNVLTAYLIIQGLDIMSTFGWSYLMFHDNNKTDDTN